MAQLQLDRVSKAFGAVQAVRELSFLVPQGSIYGLLGPNGAGKTTTIRMIMRIVLPDAGTILLDGEVVDDLKRERIGYLPEERGLYRKMQVLEHLAFLGEVRGLSRDEARKRARNWLERLGLADKASAKVEALSKGMQQKVQFAAAVIHDPPLVILDEPFTGLDPIATRQFKDEILQMAKGGVTVLFSTHVLPQAEELCTHYCLINRGRALFAGTAEEVRKRYAKPQLKLATADGAPPPENLPGVNQVEKRNGFYLLHLDGTLQAPQVVREVANRCQVAAVEHYQPTLEEIFLRAVEEDHVSVA
ncbi:MAG: ABC transporter ATP-binding protein [Acidobacteriota bacterium]|jgi:ABC-2 type transport system ATP-binding protein